MAEAGVVKVDRTGARPWPTPAHHLLHRRPRGSGKTENMIGAPELALMKPTALVVNTSRGGLIDEAALAAALREGRIGGAGIDTFDEEPPRADNPLLGTGRAILSPHIAGLTQEAMARLSDRGRRERRSPVSTAALTRRSWSTRMCLGR